MGPSTVTLTLPDGGDAGETYYIMCMSVGGFQPPSNNLAATVQITRTSAPSVSATSQVTTASGMANYQVKLCIAMWTGSCWAVTESALT